MVKYFNYLSQVRIKQPRDVEALEMMYQIESLATFPFNEFAPSEFYGTFHWYIFPPCGVWAARTKLQCILLKWLKLHDCIKPKFIGWTSGSWYLDGKPGIPGSTMA